MSDLTAAIQAARDAFNAAPPDYIAVMMNGDSELFPTAMKLTGKLEAAIAAAAPHIRAAALTEAIDALDDELRAADTIEFRSGLRIAQVLLAILRQPKEQP